MERNYAVVLNGKQLVVTVLRRTGGHLAFAVNGSNYEVEVQPILEPPKERALVGRLSGPLLTHPRAHSPNGSSGLITAPMPGIIVRLPVKEGDPVSIGDTVAVMEAMKMENNLAATLSGRVAKIHVREGTEVSNGQLLVTIERVE